MIYKYIWLDGYTPEQSLRSKIQVAEQHGMLGTNDQPPVWSFDGSSTKQACRCLSEISRPATFSLPTAQ